MTITQPQVSKMRMHRMVNAGSIPAYAQRIKRFTNKLYLLIKLFLNNGKF